MRLLEHAVRYYLALFIMIWCAGSVDCNAVAAGLKNADYVGADAGPAPLVGAGHPVDWLFVFKFNAKSFPGCDAGAVQPRSCPFGGTVQSYVEGQQFVYASSEQPLLEKSDACAGATTADPLGATFEQIFHGSYYYVVWNDQFYNDPRINGCGESCGGPWGHSKGMLVWDDNGTGMVLQVSTPSWPAAASDKFPRVSDGNTLGCVRDDNVKVSQHFFSIKVSRSDVVAVLDALRNASVVTDTKNPQVVRNGGPAEIQQRVVALGTKSTSKTPIRVQLSSGVGLISKPSQLHVPPWQLVSALLGGVSLRAATWWAAPQIYSTTRTTRFTCWDKSLGRPGAVDIATTGAWQSTVFGLKGGPGSDFNHAKIGVSTDGDHALAIFGDLNQQGTRSGDNCSSSQNGRGGLFYLVEDLVLHAQLTQLLKGGSASTVAPTAVRSTK
jgi:hypothetical protein